jgi:hypothetical protein
LSWCMQSLPMLVERVTRSQEAEVP